MNSCASSQAEKMHKNVVPDLLFPMIKYGARQVPLNLNVLLKNAVHFPPQAFRQRLTLVKEIHEILTADIIAGQSKHTLYRRFREFKSFFNWADRSDLGLDLAKKSVDIVFVKWTEFLISRVRLGQIKPVSAISMATFVTGVLDRILARQYPLLKHTRISKRAGDGRSEKNAGSKLLIRETIDLGSALVSFCEQLTIDAFFRPIPLKLEWNFQTVWLKEMHRISDAKAERKNMRNSEIQLYESASKKFPPNWILENRKRMVNFRLQAELIIFIAQTGMNLEQAFQVKLDDFHYTSHLDGYEVRAYKARRGGPVLFEIFSDYRKHLENYLTWRKEIFSQSDSNLLFPLIRTGGVNAPTFHQIKRALGSLGIKFIGPRGIRKARINWLLREMADPQKVADISQHDLSTLMSDYAQSNPQVAMVEIANYFRETEASFNPPGPGSCITPDPELIANSPMVAPEPDCITSAGCLFCTKNRDIDAADHVWSLASYRYLKKVELASFRPPKTTSVTRKSHPAEVTINRLSEKIRFFEESNETHQTWAQEANARIAEGEYHPLWDGFIQLHESMA